MPNSHGLEADAVTDLHENLLDGVFSVHALGGHGVTARVLGDTGSVAFSRTDSLIHGSLANLSFHPIHACAHSCFDGCRAGFGVCGGVVHVHLCLSCRVFLMFLMMRMMPVWMELIR